MPFVDESKQKSSVVHRQMSESGKQRNRWQNFLSSPQIRSHIRQQNPGITPQDMMKELGKQWRQMTLKEKQAFSSAPAIATDEELKTAPRRRVQETREAVVWSRWDGQLDTAWGEFGDPFDPDNPYNWDGDDMIGFR